MSAASVTLNAPVDGYNSSSTTITFNCTATDDVKIENVTLYGNWAGSWAANETNSSSGLNNTPVIFTKTITDGNYKWNCYACDNSSNCAFAASNKTFTIDTTEPSGLTDEQAEQLEWLYEHFSEAEEDPTASYNGILLENLRFILVMALVLTIASFIWRVEIEWIPFSAAMFWFASAWGVSSIKIYKAISGQITSITYMNDSHLIYLFGFMGILMLIYGSVNVFSGAQKRIAGFGGGG